MPDHDDWNAHWERYAAAATRNPAQIMRHELIESLARACAIGDRPRILDIGSGQGDLMVRLISALAAGEFVGFELSERGVEVSRRKLPEAKFITADLFNPPEQLNNYRGWASLAVCSEVLEHVDDPGAFLRTAAGYLNSDSRLIVTVPGGPMSAFDRTIGHRRHFTRETISSVLTESGFQVERVWLSGFPFFNLYRLIVIARGERLAADVTEGEAGATGKLAQAAMAVFRALFRFNLRNSRWGWQVVAVARKSG